MLACSRSHHALTCLHRGRAGIVELKTFQVARQHLGKFLHQPGLHLGGEVVTVHQRVGVFCDCLADLRMAVAKRGNVYAGRKIDIPVAVNVNKLAALAVVEYHREEFDLSAEALEIFGAAGVQLLRGRTRRGNRC